MKQFVLTLLVLPLLLSFKPGDTVPESYVREHGVEEFFVVQDIPDDVFEFMQGRSYKSGCPVPRSGLKYLTALHKDGSGRILVGEMVVAKAIAGDVLEILRALYDASYPIEKMRLVDWYEADDEASMRDNNSSCFNYRTVAGTAKVSKHGAGMAVDINPLYNPYYKKLDDGSELIQPSNAAAYLDRGASFPYKIVRGDICWSQFVSRGFIWGGGWANRKDYQHFEK